MSISAMKQALEALEKLWDIIDDIDTYGDMAKSDDKLYRSLVERRQRQRFEQTGISTDGYELNGGAITALRQAIAEAEKQEAVAWMWKDGTLTSDPDFADGTWTPLFAAPVHASDISQKPVDETAKDRHKPVAFRNIKTGEFCTSGFLRKDWAKWQPLYAAPMACDDDIYDVWVEQKEKNA